MAVHLTAAEEASGQYLPELHPTLEGSSSTLYLLEIFVELNDARATGGMGIARITFNDMLGWCQLHGETLSAFEIDVLKKLDNLFLTMMSPT